MSALGISPSPREPEPDVRLTVPDALKRAQTLFAQGALDQASHIAGAIVAKHPQHTLALQVLAAVAEKRGQREDAIQILHRSLTGDSGDALPLMNLCRLLRLTDRLEESRAAGERAVQIETIAEALTDLADTYNALGESQRALDMFQRAVAQCPDLARARLGLSNALLLTGDFRAGWSEYEWRYRLPNTQNVLPKFKQPQWNGMEMKSGRLLVVAEQGYGDCFQFARYLPKACERAGTVFLGAGAELATVLKSARGSFTCYERWELIPAFDFQITLSSLPLVFGTTLETIPAEVPYLAADPAKAAHWRTKLRDAAQGRKTMGFVWQGRPSHPNDRVRSIGLGPMTPLLQMDGILPVSLQIGEGREQLAQHPLRSRVFDAADELKDFSDTAALIDNLDCVVSIDSAIAHLTGALGKPGFVMLPKAAEWRWLEERSDSPWYPSLSLVRQRARGDWDDVVARVAAQIRA